MVKSFNEWSNTNMKKMKITYRELEPELKKLISKPQLTINEFKKLIPMLISDDEEVVRLGIELFKTYDYKNFPLTVYEICLGCNINNKEFDIPENINRNLLDYYCSKMLNKAICKGMFLPF